MDHCAWGKAEVEQTFRGAWSLSSMGANQEKSLQLCERFLASPCKICMVTNSQTEQIWWQTGVCWVHCIWGTVRVILACLEVLNILTGREDLQAHLHHRQYSSGAEIMVAAAVVAKFPVWSRLPGLSPHPGPLGMCLETGSPLFQTIHGPPTCSGRRLCAGV